jgi:hypothetical protein
MPYGIPKEIDSPAAEKFMENCVSGIEGSKGKDGKPISKQGAIMICKANWIKKHEKNKEAGVEITFSMEDMEEDTMDDNPEESKFMSECVRKMIKAGKDQQTAMDTCETIWEKTNQDSAKAEYVVMNITNKKG